MNSVPKHFSKPEDIAVEGKRLYEEQRAKLEAEHMGDFVAVDVQTGKAYIAEFPEQALEKARKDAPLGLFHLIRIGYPGAFRVSSCVRATDRSWLFQ